ncbi:MAG: hypothetical protein AB1938_31885 [Myxococcota bacterium]
MSLLGALAVALLSGAGCRWGPVSPVTSEPANPCVSAEVEVTGCISLSSLRLTNRCEVPLVVSSPSAVPPVTIQPQTGASLSVASYAVEQENESACQTRFNVTAQVGGSALTLSFTALHVNRGALGC